MPFDFRTRSLRVNRIINSGSTSTSPLLIYGLGSVTDTEGGFTVSHFTTGSDTWLFISGSSGARGTSNRGVVTFKGDIVTSGSLYTIGGLTGSLTKLVNGTDYLRAGSNVTLTTGSDGSVTIDSTGGGTPGGSDKQIQFNDGGSFGGDVDFTFNKTSNLLSLTGSFAHGATGASGPKATGTSSHAEGSSTTASGTASHAEGDNTIASGTASHAEGVGSQAIGDRSHAEGYYTTGSGDWSHAEGYETHALGSASHAEGLQSVASGSYSHAEGRLTITSGSYSHAEGYQTVTLGVYSHAEGSETIATGSYSHAEGYLTIASGSYSHAEGYQTNASGSYSHAEGRGSTSSGIYSHAEGYGSTSSGQYSHAEGNGTTSSGDYSHAEGLSATSSGTYSHAEGNGTTSSGDYSHAEGQNTTASGNYSHAEGNQTVASGQYSHAEGNQTVASGQYSHAEGGSGGGGATLTAAGNYSHAEGYNTVALGSYTHTEGFGSKAGNVGFESNDAGSSTPGTIIIDSGYGNVSGLFGSYIIFDDSESANVYGYTTFIINGVSWNGTNTIITLVDSSVSTPGYAVIGNGEAQPLGADYSLANVAGQHAEGYETNASGDYSHAEGYQTTAAGAYSHAEGYQTNAVGNGSKTSGYQTISYGQYSNASGRETIASGSYQHVVGKYNTRDNVTSLFVVGDGSGDSNATRRDVLRVNSGSVQVTGSLVAPNITGSLTRLANGTEYLKPGSNVTLTTGSDGSITIAAAGGGGGATSPAGSNTYLQFNADGSFGAVANLTFATSSNTLSLNGSVDTQIADTRWYLRNNSADALSFWDGSGGSRRFQLNMGDSQERLIAYDNAGFAAGDSSDLTVLHDGTNSYIKNNTGALIISGANSLILTGSVYSLDNVTIAGDLAVNGGDITSNQSTATIFSTNVSSLAIGGVASSISLGNSSNANGFTLNVAASRTGSISINLATGATISGLTKNINIGQGGDPGSITNIKLGTTDTAATTNIYVSGSSYVTGSVSIKGSIIPDSDTMYTLGTDQKRWAHVYTGDLHLRNERGDWTVIEEVDFLRIVNNKTGKNFKMMMQPIDD
jgi:hypothetical protein